MVFYQQDRAIHTCVPDVGQHSRYRYSSPARAAADAPAPPEGAPEGAADADANAGDADDAFAGIDTPKSAPAALKLCLVCMDADRGERFWGAGWRR